MDYSFVFEGKTYYITIKGNKTFYMDESHNILNGVDTSEIENKMFNYFAYNYTESSELDNAIQSNQNLTTQRETFRQFFKYIENYVPLSKKEEFYEKVKTLKYENLAKTKKTNDGSCVFGTYKSYDNTIKINEEECKKANQISFNYGNAVYLTTLFHELTHMASSSYDRDNIELVTGFNCIKDKLVVINDGLTEGMTEYITLVRFINDSSCDSEIKQQAQYVLSNSSYYFNLILIAQLCAIIGPNVIYGSYFQNLGIVPLCKKLSELDFDFNNALNLFAMIETDYLNRKEGGFTQASNLLGSIQMKIINYFRRAIINDILNGESKEKISERIALFETILISENLLKYKNMDINDYPEIAKSLQTFQKFKDDINDLFESYNQDNKNMTL